MRSIHDLIEDPRSPEELQEDIEDSTAHPWVSHAVEDATCHTVVMYQLAQKLRSMIDEFLKQADKERHRAYTVDEEFVIVAGWLTGLDGTALTSSLTNAIHELAIAIEYDYWIDEHKQPRPKPIAK